MLDVAVVGGWVVDGTGGARRRADVGIRDGLVVQVGELDEAARETIDADGRIVAPGFIDVHTHYDAQWGWDPHLSPSSFHGVTTVLAGNCGFTLAPMEASAADYLTEMLARVEGMPLTSLRQGVDLDWRSFEQFLAAVDGNVAVNAGFLVGHSTVRRITMGDDWRRPATDDEVGRMGQLVTESLAAGALGFSSSWSDTHSDGSGDPVPSRFATEEELLQLCHQLRPFEGTWLEFLPWASGPFPEERVQLMARMSVAAQRPLNWNLLTVRPDISDEAIESRLRASDVARRAGGEVLGLTLPIPQTLYLNLDSGFLFDSLPEWAAVLGRPMEEKLDLLARPEVRHRLAAVATASPRIWYDLDQLYFQHIESARFADAAGLAVAEAARRRGVDPWTLLFDVVVADRLHTLLVVPPQGDDAGSWARRARLWRDDRTLLGGSDAGAHLDMLDTFAFFTDLLGPSVRDRQLLSLEEGVQMVTDEPARAFGLTGRGRLQEGYAADVVVFDEHTIRTGPPLTRTDLPGNQPRLYADAVGVDKVLVNGQTIIADGQPTDARPGRVLRSGRDTRTVAVTPSR